MLEKLFNLYLYTNIHISICTGCLIWSTYHIFDQPVHWTYIGFSMCGTWLLYNVHRYIGTQKIKNKQTIPLRYTVFRQAFPIIRFSSFFIILLGIYCFFSLESAYWIYIVLGMIPSLLYILPIFQGHKRLRDFGLIKIFVVGVTWAYLTSYVPLALVTSLPFSQKICYLLGQSLFIVAITIPFDYRDRAFDQSQYVNTLVSRYSKVLNYGIIFFFLAAMLMFGMITVFSLYDKAIVVGTYVTCMLITLYACRQKQDFYISGLVDATMIIFALLTGILIS